MTRHELLQEQYEDALFALLMDEVATSEGKKALEENETLLNDPDAAVPERTAHRCIKAIGRQFAKQHAHATGHVAMKVLNKVALVALVGTLLFVGVFASSPTFRAKTLNFVNKTFDDYTDFTFRGSGKALIYQDWTIEIGWLPEGYQSIDQHESGQSLWYLYENAEGASINIELAKGAANTMNVDTEDAIVEKIEVQGLDATLITKLNEFHVVMGDPQKAIMVWVLGTDPAREDVIQVAANLVF